MRGLAVKKGAETVAEKDIIQETLPSIPDNVNIEWLIDRVVFYCEKQAGVEFRPYQREFAERIVESIILNDGEELTALFSRQSGKTETVATIMAGIMVIIPILAQMPQFEELIGQFKNGVWIGLFAPSNEQAFTTFSRTRDRLRSGNAKMILNDPEIDTTLDKESNPMMLSNGSLMRMQSAAKQSQIESKTYHILIVEEAQDVEKTKVLKSIHPMGAATNATIIKIGTSNNKRCEFLETINRNKRQDMKRRGRRNHFEYDYTVAQKYNPRYKKFIEKEKRRLGEDSDEFRMSYKLEWLLERGMFLSEDMKEKLLDRKLKHELGSEKYCAVGIDCGKKKDSTVVTVLEVDWSRMEEDLATGEMRPYKRILNWLEIYGDDYESQYYEVLDFLKPYNIKCIYIDSTGVGTPIADRLKYGMEGIADVIAYDFTTPSKSVMWKSLNTEINAGRLVAPAHAKTRELRTYKNFENQFDTLEKDWRGQYMVCSHPKDDKDGKDDFPDSLGLANLAAHHEAMPDLEVCDNKFFHSPRRY